LAIKSVAQVLHHGEQKYGLDNLGRLSVEECHNHTLGHAISFNRSNTIEDLAHTACRALMTLELALREEANAESLIYPDLSTCPCPKCSGLSTDDTEKPLTLEKLNQRFNDLSRIVRTSNKIYEVKGILKNE
jgi:hypothetical protein